MTGLSIYRNTVRVLATLGFGLIQYEFVPFGALSGVIAGLIVTAIWISRELDPK